jgi:hypothetical protein
MRFRQGDFAGGAADYLWRFRIPGIQEPELGRPRWDGAPLAGRTLLLWDDQGLGDTVHFVRYAEQLAQLGGRVVALCRRQLVRLLQTCRGLDQVSHDSKELQPFDVFISMPDLPGLLKTTVETIPANVPYVSGDAAMAARWRDQWQSISELKVGIVWQGDRTNTADAQRSIPLERFYKLARIDGVRLFSLQFGEGREDLKKLPADVTVTDLGDQLGDFYQTAAAMQNLDLIITCDSAPCHLAGAVGAPVWVALAQLADWRWLHGRSDTPWYPSMRLFRQSRFGDWEEVFERIGAELAEVAAARRRGSK